VEEGRNLPHSVEERQKEEIAAGGGEEGRNVPHFFEPPPLLRRVLDLVLNFNRGLICVAAMRRILQI
jgi:hypothetical protein